MRKTITITSFAFALVLGIALAGYWYYRGSSGADTEDSTISAVFTCDKGVVIHAEFRNGSERSVRLAINDGRDLLLPQAVSASGARYADKDEKFVFWNKGDTAFVEENGTRTIDGCVVKTDVGFKNATYLIDGKSITLSDGAAETPAAPGSASKIVTRYFGNDIRKDLDGDGREDAAFIITQETGGSGIFFYFTGALNTADGWVGTDAVLLGDRIAPQTTESGKNRIVVVNYADRKFGEPMTTKPSEGKTRWFMWDTDAGRWAAVAVNFEGESAAGNSPVGLANPASVNCENKGGNLVMKTDPNGGQYGLCFFGDNRACEEWAMMRGECPVGGVKTTGYDTEAQKFCAWSGGKTLAVKDAVCEFSDGSSCLADAFYAGTCRKGEVKK